MFTRFLTIAILICASLCLHADDAENKAKDIANMRKIWEAIQAYRKVKGDVPAYLHELVPDFLPDKGVFISPRERDGGPTADESGDPTLPCSYGYNFIGEGKQSQNAEMKKQMEEFGDITPILSRFIDGKVIHVSFGGEVFESKEEWERSEFVSDWLAKHNVDPGKKDSVPLRLTVADAKGDALAGVTVKARRSAPRYTLPDRSVVTGADGIATIPVHKNVDSHNVFSFEKEGLKAHLRFWPVRDSDGIVEADPTKSLRVSMYPTANASGIIRGPSDKPIEGASVTLAVIDDRGKPENYCYSTQKATGPDGRWEIKDIPGGGEYKVQVNHQKLRNLAEKAGEKGAPDLAAMISGKGDIKLLAPYPITGKVTAGGKPVQGATVWFQSSDGDPDEPTTTDAHGAFNGGSTNAATGQLVVYAKGHAPRMLAYKGEFLPVELNRGKPLKGRVVDQAGSGVAGLPILMQAFEELYISNNLPVIAITDADGNFEWRDGPENNVGLCVPLPSGQNWHAQARPEPKGPAKNQGPGATELRWRALA